MAHLFAHEDLNAVIGPLTDAAKVVFRVSLSVEPLTTETS
jgi:hypothetical protein